MSLSLVESPSGRPDVELIALEDALQRLAALDERKSRVVELKFFGGLTIEEIAEVLAGLRRDGGAGVGLRARLAVRRDRGSGAEE